MNMDKIKKVLVANRGEIAIRVFRACHHMGIPVVAVYSDADREALHVRCADEAVHLGASQPAESYLNQDKVIDAALKTGATAIHPGYGFLAENADFARKCADAGLTFLGPSADAIAGMGDKIRSRETMKAANVPLVPGRSGVTRENLKQLAEEVGYPIMLKASAGGGGKGIRIVHDPSQVEEAFDRAQGEARTSFGDATVYIERYFAGAHHIEIQILGDMHGNVRHLFERECSVQRRNQKVIEEAPSAFMTEGLRQRMGEAAILAAKAIGYTSAGTVEFLVDHERNFYFLEMNTRLQVEHPITERIVGKDLVMWQLRIAAGEALDFEQDELQIHGHAIEARICAEDPENGFLPSVGRIDSLVLPGGPGVRWDSAMTVGQEISLFYDSMLGKLIVWGSSREKAIARMRQALSEFRIADLKTNAPYLGRILRNEEFLSGVYDTGILTRMEDPEIPDELLEAAAVAAVLNVERRARHSRSRSDVCGGDVKRVDPWKLAGRRQAMRGW